MACRRRDIGIGELLGIFRHLLFPLGVGIERGRDFALEDDIRSPFGPHDRDFGGRPRDHEVRPEVPGAHRYVSSTVRLPENDGDLRDRRLAEGIEEFRAMTNDARVFLVHPRKIPREVHERYQRDIECITETYEPGSVV